MSVLNGEKYLKKAIESILSQTFTDFEFIIVDDGSEDSTSDIIKSYTDSRIKLIQNNHKGTSASVNEGISLASGELIARMDADDISLPERLERQVEYLDNHPDFVLVGTAGKIIDEEGYHLGRLERPANLDIIREKLKAGILPFFNGSSVFRKSAAEKCGLYDEQMITIEDWYLGTKMINIGKMTNLSDFLYQYRLSRLATTTMSHSIKMKRRAIMQRILETGTISEGDAKSLREIKQKFSLREMAAQYYLDAGKALISWDWQPKRALSYLVKSIYYMPFNLRTWFHLFLCFIPPLWVKSWKSYREKRAN